MVFVLYNPTAGNGRAAEAADRLRKEAGNQEIKEYNLLETKDCRAIAGQLSAEDTVYIVGGDGTLNRFINAVGDTEIPAEVFFYPAGTGNDLKNDVDPENKSDRIRMNGFFSNLPVATIKGKEYRFFNGIGFGIDGYCCQEGDRLRGRSDKPVNYTKIAIKGLLGKYRPRNARVTVDGVTREYRKVWLAPTMMGRFYGGGMMVTPGQDRNNAGHTLTCAVMWGTGKLKTLVRFPKIFTGRHVKYTDMMDMLQGHEITVEFDEPCALQVDGETVLDVKSYSVRYF